MVCNYGPSGNIGNDPVYDIAETPCDCPCVDCDQEEGMCPSDPRFGFWAGWSRWGECSKTCGGGVKRRTTLRKGQIFELCEVDTARDGGRMARLTIFLKNGLDGLL